jgi:hypothetical protein
MGAWLADRRYFLKGSWRLDSRKMEEATFNMFHGSVFYTDIEYHVKHLSMFEHSVRQAKKLSSDNMNSIIGKYLRAAYAGECSNVTVNKRWHSYLTIIPFYGGLPPIVNGTIGTDGRSTDGEGHSKTSPELKTLTCLATACSCLKYFGRVVIAVASIEDEDRIKKQVIYILPIIVECTDSSLKDRRAYTGYFVTY